MHLRFLAEPWRIYYVNIVLKVEKLKTSSTTMKFGTAFEGWSRVHIRAVYKIRRVSTNAFIGITDPHAYCKDLVRKYDYDSFLTSYFYPREAQSGFFAIKAFSVSSPSLKVLASHL